MRFTIYAGRSLFLFITHNMKNFLSYKNGTTRKFKITAFLNCIVFNNSGGQYDVLYID